MTWLSLLNCQLLYHHDGVLWRILVTKMLVANVLLLVRSVLGETRGRGK